MVPENDTDESRPVTHFQKVASALHGDKQADTVPTVPAVPADEAEGDYWDNETPTTPDRPVAVTQPDGLAPRPAPPASPAPPAFPPPPAFPAPPASPAPPADPEPAGGADHAATMPDVFADQDADRDQTAATEPEAPAPATDAGLRPGQAADSLGDFGDMAYGKLIPDAEEFRARWQQIQFKFVDDPPGSVTEAADVVAEVSTRLEAAIQERQRIITERQRTLRDRWSQGANADTEALRETLRIYRGFLDQLLGTSWGPGR